MGHAFLHFHLDFHAFGYCCCCCDYSDNHDAVAAEAVDDCSSDYVDAGFGSGRTFPLKKRNLLNSLLAYPISTLVLLRLVTSWIASFSLLIIVSLIIPLIRVRLVLTRLVLALILISLRWRIVGWRLTWNVLRSPRPRVCKSTLRLVQNFLQKLTNESNKTKICNLKLTETSWFYRHLILETSNVII